MPLLMGSYMGWLLDSMWIEWEISALIFVSMSFHVTIWTFPKVEAKPE